MSLSSEQLAAQARRGNEEAAAELMNLDKEAKAEGDDLGRVSILRDLARIYWPDDEKLRDAEKAKKEKFALSDRTKKTKTTTERTKRSKRYKIEYKELHQSNNPRSRSIYYVFLILFQKYTGIATY